MISDSQFVVHLVEDVVHNSILSLPPSPVIVGVSGGADSVALLVALSRLNVNVIAAHCNFGLRGEESLRDQRHVENLCASLGIHLESIAFDVPSYMSSYHLSVEMACRKLRYDWFDSLLNKYGACRIAVAHNADDNAETLFLNLMRGAGIAGLRAMLPDTGRIIRPLLSLPRTSIEGYLEALNIEFIVDSSNLSTDYQRNFIRHDIIPALESRWPSARKSIAKSISALRQEEEMLLRLQSQYFSPGASALKYDTMSDHTDREWAVRRWCSQFGADPFMASQMVDVMERSPFVSGKKWITHSGTITAERDALVFSSHKDNSAPIEIDVECVPMSPETEQRILRAPLSELWITVSPDSLVFRRPRTGDKIEPLGLRGSTLISKILKDAKLSAADKRCVVIAARAADNTPVWVEGLKRSRLLLCDFSAPAAYRITVRR